LPVREQVIIFAMGTPYHVWHGLATERIQSIATRATNINVRRELSFARQQL